MKPTYSKKSKYGSRKVTIDGVTYDSMREYLRWCDLKLLERAGEISGLQRQVKYELIPSQRGKTRTERATSYIADFVYRTKTGETVVEDSKGFKTKDYIIKRKLMLQKYGIEIQEV